MALEWTPALSTGVLELDHQHRKLFDFINELKDSLADPVKAADTRTMVKAVKFIREYTEIHFITEEACMARYMCPVAKVNEQAHARFLKAARKFEAGLAVMEDPAAHLAEFEEFLGAWWTNHICAIDVNLKGVAPAA